MQCKFYGRIAQSVEQRTENPCVAGSIPAPANKSVSVSEDHIVYCLKLHISAEGLSAPPFPTPLGQRIYENISQQAWEAWLGQQTMLINENKLSMIDKKSRDFLKVEMERFLFGG